MKVFVYDPNLAELAAELREKVREGRMPYQDAIDALKKAIRTAFEQRAQIVKDESTN